MPPPSPNPRYCPASPLRSVGAAPAIEGELLQVEEVLDDRIMVDRGWERGDEGGVLLFKMVLTTRQRLLFRRVHGSSFLRSPNARGPGLIRGAREGCRSPVGGRPDEGVRVILVGPFVLLRLQPSLAALGGSLPRLPRLSLPGPSSPHLERSRPREGGSPSRGRTRRPCGGMYPCRRQS